jgi:aspartate kinase
MIVMKFGGSSVESAAAIEGVASIVKAHLDRRPVVVVSAIGKTTKQLLVMGAEAAQGHRDRALVRLENLRGLHEREFLPVISAADRKQAEGSVESHFREMGELIGELADRAEFTPRSADAIASYGERLSSELLALALRNFQIDSVWVDARSVIRTDARHTHAAPLLPQTYARLREAISPLAAENKVVVVGGFIGSTEDGIPTTLGLEGSDITAALVGAGLGADEIQIWTDVNGVLTCDPNVVPEARRVRTISFAEAAELAYFGAKVLHPATLLPAAEKNIPILVLNSRRPEAPGTRIVAEPVACANTIKAISCKPGMSIVTVRSTRTLTAHGFLRRVFEILDRAETPVDMLASSEVSISLAVDDASRLPAICEELRRFSEVSVENDQAIVCVVGDTLRDTPGIAARVFGAVAGVNVRMISQGASHLNLSFVVAAEDLRKTADLLHRDFFRDPDPAVFD